MEKWACTYTYISQSIYSVNIRKYDFDELFVQESLSNRLLQMLVYRALLGGLHGTRPILDKCLQAHCSMKTAFKVPEKPFHSRVHLSVVRLWHILLK